jgi:hypothetical protein
MEVIMKIAIINSNNLVENVVVGEMTELELMFPGKKFMQVEKAITGWVLYEELALVLPPKPNAGWDYNRESEAWEAPTPMPTDSDSYYWSEEDLSWKVGE